MLNRDEYSLLSADDVADCRQALYDLTDWVNNGYPYLHQGILYGQTFTSLIIVDADVASWSALLLPVVTLSDSPSADD